MKNKRINIGDKFIATTIDQTVEVKDIIYKTEKSGKKRPVLSVEIIRNQFPGMFEWDLETYRPGLLNTDLYEPFV